MEPLDSVCRGLAQPVRYLSLNGVEKIYVQKEYQWAWNETLRGPKTIPVLYALRAYEDQEKPYGRDRPAGKERRPMGHGCTEEAETQESEKKQQTSTDVALHTAIRT